MWKDLLIIAGFWAFACSRTQAESSTTSSAVSAIEGETERIAPATDKESREELAFAYFAGGCFWGVEHYLERMPGVISVESGYMGGHVESPAYKQVVGKKTGHLETVRVRYHPTQVSYEELSKRFFEIHDPTQADGQGPDLGPQYRSAVFYGSPAEKRTIEGHIAELRARGFRVVTELKQDDKFWPAEAFHQDYYQRTGKKPYCHTRVRRFDKPRLDQ